jgi:DNA-binding ferritin-like protein
VGKTQLAIEYGHRFSDDYDVIWLISAEQDELIGGQLAQLAITAGLVGADVATQAAVQALHAAVQATPRWLLIFDNAEDPQTLAAWLPPRGGHVIITSRNPGWEIAAPVEVSLFDRAESITLLQQRIPGIPQSDATRLAEELGDLPLAVAQAASFMADTGMPTGEYLDHLHEHTTQILANGRPNNYPTSLAATINLAADRLAQDNPAAAQLLSLCSVLAPEPIPLRLFSRSAALLPEPLAGVAVDWSAFYAAVKAIGDHGLAGTSHQGLQIHRLIQAIIRDRTSGQEQSVIRDHVKAVLVAAAPSDTDDPATWPVWATLAPHINAVDPATTTSEQLRTVACQVVLYLLRRGERRPALHLAEQLHRRWSDRLGPDDVHTLKATTEYAHAQHALGNIHQAHAIIEDTLARYRRVLGDNHLDTLRSAHDFAVSLNDLGEYAQAYDLHQDTRARRQRILGNDHPDTLQSAHSLAFSLRALGEYAQARDMRQDTLVRRRRVLGDDHPDTLHSAQSLAASLNALGEHAQAHDMHQDTHAQYRQILGDDHPDTLHSAQSLAASLNALGEHAQAHDIHQDTHARRQRILGNDHPDTLQSAHGLARSLYSTGRIIQARRMIDDVLKRMRQVLGPKHPRTRQAYEDRKSIVRSMGGLPARQPRQPKRKGSK